MVPPISLCYTLPFFNHFQPFKPLVPFTKINKPFTYALRIKRICSTFEEYRKYSQDLIKRFVEKGYDESTVKKQNERVDHLDRSLLLKNCEPKRKDLIPFSVT